ncbi:MAG: PAS domain-containing protein [Lachnospiraceae bacterium]|nr:PAS domain-containing protein [Lachnospiraceae bacterium]
MDDKSKRRDRYSDGFALTKYTMPVVWQMADVIPGGFFIYREDEKRELIYASQRVLEIYGCKTLDEFKELTGYTFEGMVYHEDFPEIQTSIDAQIDSEDGDSMDYVVYRIVRKDGKIRWVDDYGHYSYSPDYGDVYYVFISDITEKKLLQDEEKSIGKLIGRVDRINEMADRLEEAIGDNKAAKEQIDALRNELSELRERIPRPSKSK